MQIKLKRYSSESMIKSSNIIIHHQWLQVHLKKQLSFDSKCCFLGSTHRNKNMISKFQLDNVIKIQVNEQLGNLLSFCDLTEAMISSNEIRTKTIPTQGLSLQMTRGEGLAKSVVISSEQ